MAIYDIVVPKEKRLRQINDLVDCSFVSKELKEKDFHDNGRTAVPPTRMFNYLLQKSIFDLSDVDVVECSKCDMSFKYFLDLSQGASVIHPSSLAKFRKLRLQNVDLLNLLLQKTIDIALEKERIQTRDKIEAKNRELKHRPADTRSHDPICGQSQANDQVNERCRVRKTK